MTAMGPMAVIDPALGAPAACTTLHAAARHATARYATARHRPLSITPHADGDNGLRWVAPACIGKVALAGLP